MLKAVARDGPGRDAGWTKTARLAAILEPWVLEKRELRRLALQFDEVWVAAGTVLASQGQMSHQLCLLVEGTAIVSVEGAPVAVLGPGDVVGEAAVLRPAPHRASVVTRAPTHLLVASLNGCRRLRDHPAFLRLLADDLADRLRQAQGPSQARVPMFACRRASS